jgi:hypothetical protein
MLGQEPRLPFAGADHLGDQQVVAAVVTALCGPSGSLVGVDEDGLVGLQQP